MKRMMAVICTALLMLSFAACSFRPAGEIPGEETKNNTSVATDGTADNIHTDGDTDVSTDDAGTDNKSDYVEATSSFVGCGDNIIYYGNVREAATKAPAGRQYGFAYSYERVGDIIAGADVAFINQETLMCGEGYELSYYPHFNSPRDLGYDLAEVGFDVVNIANNHMLDKGSDGLGKTIEFWKTLPVLMIGGYESEEDFNTPRYHESNGIKIAFLSFADHTNGLKNYGKNVWVPYLDEKDTGMAQSGVISDEAIATIEKQVAEAKKNSDIVIVSVHWGDEGKFAPSVEQKKFAQIFADAGVDVVVGHHPHVIEPVEWVTGEDGNEMLCVYSLGNFMAEQAYDYNMVGGMISFDMVKYGDGRTEVENVKFIPTVFHHTAAFYNNQVWLMEEYTAEMASSHGISYYGNYTSYDKLKKYVTDTIAPEFLPDSIKN